MKRQSKLKIVLTGGPSAGKTALANLIQREFSHDAVIVPETASILFSGGFPRGQTPNEVIHQQRAIYAVQIELEDLFDLKSQGKILICDRGTLDGLAYWPKNTETFFESLKTTSGKEFARYDAVIHLETPRPKNYDSENNPARNETPDEAMALDQKIKKIWMAHPKHFTVTNSTLFSLKMLKGIDIIKLLIQELS